MGFTGSATNVIATFWEQFYQAKALYNFFLAPVAPAVSAGTCVGLLNLKGTTSALVKYKVALAAIIEWYKPKGCVSSQCPPIF